MFVPTDLGCCHPWSENLLLRTAVNAELYSLLTGWGQETESSGPWGHPHYFPVPQPKLKKHCRRGSRRNMNRRMERHSVKGCFLDMPCLSHFRAAVVSCANLQKIEPAKILSQVGSHCPCIIAGGCRSLYWVCSQWWLWTRTRIAALSGIVLVIVF